MASLELLRETLTSRFPLAALLASLVCSCASTPGRDRALDPVMQTTFCTDGKTMVVSTTTSQVALFDVDPLSFRDLLTPENSKSSVSLTNVLRSPHVACSPDSRLVVAAGIAGEIIGWEADTRQVRFNVVTDSSIHGLAFLPDGDSFVVAGNNVRRHSSQTGLVLDEINIPDEATATAVTVHPDGRSILAGLSDGRIIEMSVHSRQIIRTLEGHSAPVTGVAFSPDGLTFASTAGSFDPRLWNRGEEKPVPRRLLDSGNVKEVLGNAQRFTDALALFTWLLGSARGFEIVGAPTMGAPQDLTREIDRAGRQTSQYCEPSVAYSPDGRYLAATAHLSLLSGEYHLLLIDLHRSEGRVFSGVYGCSITFSRDSRFAATGGLGAPMLRDVGEGW